MPSSTPSHWIARACEWLMGVDHVTTEPGREVQTLDLFAGCELEVRAGSAAPSGDGRATTSAPASHIG